MLRFVHNSGLHPSAGIGAGCGGVSPAFVASGASISPAHTVTINSTGATLLVAVVGSATSAPTISDSVGGQTNAWNLLTAVQSTTGFARIAYAFAKTGGGPLQTGASHVFTPAGGSSDLAVFAFSGTLTTASVFDSANQTGNQPSPAQPGSIIPTAGDLVVTGFGSNGTGMSGVSVNSSFIGLVTQSNGSTNELVAGAYLLNAANSALNPTWTATVTGTDSNLNALIACFK